MKLFWANDVADRVLSFNCILEHAFKQNFWHFPTGASKDIAAKKKAVLSEMKKANNSHSDKKFNLITSHSKAS